ncbi:MAG: hypothetical protein ABI593_08470 [Betaproteobacteria bacterium]
MRLPDAIRRRGFRRWYERQLYESHAYLVTGLLALIMMAIAIEVIQFRHSLPGFVALLAIGAAGGMVCIYSWRQFTFLLFRAEYVAERATCPSCHVHGRIVVDAAEDVPETMIGCTLDVHCRQCGHCWSIR